MNLIYALSLSAEEAALRIKALADQVTGSRPGILNFNFHPQNIDATIPLHEAVLEVARRPGWLALGMEDYLDWLVTLEGMSISRTSQGKLSLTSLTRVPSAMLRWPTEEAWVRQPVTARPGHSRLKRPRPWLTRFKNWLHGGR